METKTGLPATLAGFEDRARFAITVQEQTLGTIDVEWRPDGSFESRSRIAYAGQTLETSLSIVPDEQGRWREIVCQLRAGKLTVTREGSSVTRRFGDRTSTLETPAECLIFDNEAPTLIGQALMRYRRPAGGAQKFPLLLAIKKPVELTLESLGSFEGDPGLTRFRYGVPGLDLYVVADEVCRIYLLEVPAQKTVLVREGFEALLQPQVGRYPLAIVRGAGVPMRDGVELSTDLYLPQGVDQAPVILIRTPYRKEMLELKARTFASRGYVAAVQDCRGCFASPGLWEPLVHEGADGYDAVEWLAGQPYSNGKVGMMGGSYMGWTQWTAAAQNPPHLVTMIPSVSPPDPFYNLPYEYGAFFMMGVLWWIEVVETRATADLAGTVMYRLADRRYSEMLRALPVIDLDKSVLGGENRYWRKWIEHSTEDEYWQRAGFLDKLEHANLPVFHQSGWFDGDGIGSKLNYLQMVAHGHGFQKLTLGPWGHTDTATRMVLDRDFGENALVDLQGEYLRWFDRWLKDVDNGIERDPLVNLFVMGANVWARGNTYPLEGAEFRPLYLGGGGRLAFEAPPADTPADRYTYDPGDPTPDFRVFEESEEDRRRVRPAGERDREAAERHRRVAESRRDVLVYETEPLAEPLRFAGPVAAVLYAASSARDTDWFVTLSEVDGEGKIFQLVQGVIRARFRNSMRQPELLEPGVTYRYRIDLWHTGVEIPAGGRLRVEVTSAAFPRFSRNLNTGGHNETETEWAVAEQTVFHDAGRASHVLLPVIGRAQ
jgi:hypothetical protein